jgi:peroxiredoxin
MVKKGDSIPSATLRYRTEEGIQEIDAKALFEPLKKVVVFAVPGAFTPTCSGLHLPGYIDHREAFLKKGVEEIFCVSVNDPFVMTEWARIQKVGNAVRMLADGNGEFTKAMGLTFDGSGFGMGLRSQRYAMVVEQGIIQDLFVDAPGQFQVSSAEALLNRL